MAFWLGVAVACSGGSSNPTAPTQADGGSPEASDSDDGGTDEPLTATEHDTYRQGSDPVPSIQQLAAIADSLFDFDPTIDPTKTAAENASAIAKQIAGNLGAVGDAGPTCGSVVLNGASVTVDFGSGCKLTNGVTASGRVTATVSQASGTTTITLAFSSLVVDGASLSGTASFATTNGTAFTTNANLTTASTTYVVTNLAIASTAGTITINGAVGTGTGDQATTSTFGQVSWKLGTCYPSAGTITIKRGLITAVVTFSATTPSTGAVTVTIGRKNSPETLPAYGKCGSDGGI
jgi:hypothetical protein